MLAAASSALFVTTLIPLAARAQEVRLSGEASAATHDLLSSPEGFGLAVGFQLSRRIGLRVGYELHRDRFLNSGSTCVGLVPPGQDCAAEVRSNRAQMRVVGVGLPIVVSEGERVTMLLVPGVRDAWVDSRQVGERTGRTRSAEEDMYGLELGGELRMRLWGNTPLHATVGGVLALLLPWSTESVADGYTPFQGGIALAGLELAISAVRP